MLFNVQKLFSLFMASMTLFGLTTAFYFPGLLADVQQEIDDCIEICTPVKSDLTELSKYIDDEHWETAKKSFSTCQWKCYRCSLQKSVAAMDNIEAILSSDDDNKNIDSQVNDILKGVTNCANRWAFAGVIGCQKSPVENADLDCKRP